MKSPFLTGDERTPALIAHSEQLDAYLKTLPAERLAASMQLSKSLSLKTHAVIASWGGSSPAPSLAIDSFVGDIYSGLRGSELSPADRDYADTVLYILSGLYGVLRPYDTIQPYRLEMGYRLPDNRYKNLYSFWGDAVAKVLPTSGLIVNLSAVEYAKTITPYVSGDRIVVPKFLTRDPKTKEPKFVVVHAKIARGAFARWLIQDRINEKAELSKFSDLGYRYFPELNEGDNPTFVCDEFGGIGLSMRLK